VRYFWQRNGKAPEFNAPEFKDHPEFKDQGDMVSGRRVSARPQRPAGRVADVAQAGTLARLATSSTVRRQRRVWSRRVNSWDHHTPSGLEKVATEVLAAASVRSGDRVVDLGCGTGQLSLPLAECGARVLAVDISSQMIARMVGKARDRSLSGVEGVAMPIEDFSMPAQSVDMVVTSYALHHLRDPDKSRVVSAAYDWLRPGGTLIVADMMFGRGATRHDRAIIKSKVKALWQPGRRCSRGLVSMRSLRPRSWPRPDW
jgi:2-polyprenyl-3-methyl-5-hydroxy-6-metoxy-1,4-benzoquinol methylase